MKRKTLKQLTLKDNFLFGAVMCDEENCRRFLEMVLQFSIARVEVSKEKSILYHPEYKGVRLDIYAKDEKNTHYNVEMQTISKAALGKRARYYHSQIDMELLFSGSDYAELSDAYVIFICDFDPFGEGKFCYTFEQKCIEAPHVNLLDGCRSVFLSTKGQNYEEVSVGLVKFLEYVKADLQESQNDFGDEYVARLQSSVQHIKSSRKMEEVFMIWKEMLQDERAEGRAEGLAEAVIVLLEEKGDVPESLKTMIMDQRECTVLKNWTHLAAKADSVDYFLENM